MSPSSRATGPRSAPMHPDQIIDAAVELTAAHGLDGWTVRDLAQAAGTWPNTITYHVGDREAVLHAVVDRVVALMPNPPVELGWQDWFRTFLHAGAEVLGQYGGVARRLCRDGPAVPAALPIIDRGVGLLRAAGFAAAPQTYALLLNSAFLLVAIDQERSVNGQSSDQTARSLLAMDPPPERGAGWDDMKRHLARWAESPVASRRQLFTYTVETLIAGLEAELAPAGTR